MLAEATEIWENNVVQFIQDTAIHKADSLVAYMQVSEPRESEQELLW